MSMKDFYMTALFHVMLHKAVLTQKEALYITWWNGRPGMDDWAMGACKRQKRAIWSCRLWNEDKNKKVIIVILFIIVKVLFAQFWFKLLK